MTHSFTPLYQQFHDSILSGDSAKAPPLRPHPRLSAAQQLAIYQDGYQIRLGGVLTSAYPATLSLLGQNIGQTLIRDYIRITPSLSPNLDLYPHGFADFIVRHSTHAAAIEMAQLEATILQVFQAADSPALSLQDFAALAETTPFEDIRLSPRTASSLLQTAHDVETALSHFREHATMPPVAPTPCFLYLCRHENAVQRHRLDANGFTTLQNLIQGQTLAELYLNTPPENLENLNLWLGSWIAGGFFQMPVS